MPDFDFGIYRLANIGGTNGFQFGGTVTVRDDNGFRDTIFDDIEQAPPFETNGDQRIIASNISELDVGDTVRSRGLYRMTNNDTGETFDDIFEVFSQTAGNPPGQLFVFSSPPPAWLFDNTNRTLSLINSDGTIAYTSIDDTIVCFAAGTLIQADGGCELPVETLGVGDRVRTLDGSAQVIRWIGSRKVRPVELQSNPKLRPVRITAGALGCSLPRQDLLVSRQHRVLVRSRIVERMFGITETLVPAIKMVGIEGIDVVDDLSEVEYFHILFDKHEVIYSNGAPTESLFTGPEAMKAISAEARAEIEKLFPEICEPGFLPVPARFIPSKGKQIKQLAMRHHKNGRPLLEVF